MPFFIRSLCICRFGYPGEVLESIPYGDQETTIDVFPISYQRITNGGRWEMYSLLFIICSFIDSSSVSDLKHTFFCLSVPQG
jgi:hypothetical protein